MLTHALKILEDNPLVRDLTIGSGVVLVMIQGAVILHNMDKISQNQYAYPKQIIDMAMSDVNTPEQAIELHDSWEKRGWDAQIAATRVLCGCAGRGGLDDKLGVQGAINLCRVAQ